MILSCIAAVAKNGVIGRANGLPWHLSADLRRFKRLTTGHTILMGRKTYESIGRPLPNRRNVVLTRSPTLAWEGVDVESSLDDALRRCAGESEVFVIGGHALYDLALPRADRLYLTRVLESFAGDVFFPTDAIDEFTLVSEEPHDSDEKNPYPYNFCVYERRG